MCGLIGACSVYVFSSWALRAVGNAAQVLNIHEIKDVIKEVRRQFKEKPEILDGTVLPNYRYCVEIVTKAGLREMVYNLEIIYVRSNLDF